MPRGAKPGERRGGRQKGTPNSATTYARVAIGELEKLQRKLPRVEIEELAREHAPKAMQALVDVCSDVALGPARVPAAIAILDRAFGRPKQAIAHENPDGSAIQFGRSDDFALLREIVTMGIQVGVPVTIEGELADAAD